MNDFRAYNNYIYHHGIKGQKWGVRNGPPYPLDASDHSAAEKKAAKGGSKKLSTSTSDISKKKVQNKSSVKINSKKINNMKVNSLKKVGEMDSDTVEAIAYLSAMTLLTLAPFIIRGVSTLAWKSKKNKEFNTLKKNAEVKTVEELPKMTKKQKTSDNVTQTNPGYPANGRTMNCVLCTTAMAMREKGYDVKANETQDGWDVVSATKNTWNNAKIDTHLDLKETKDLVKEYGDGSYGNLAVFWNYGGGHSMFWKNEGGKMVIYDGQNGKTYSMDDFKNKIDKYDIYLIRLDNATPKNDITAFVSPR